MKIITHLPIVFSIAGVLSLAGILSNADAAPEQPEYTIVLSSDGVEVREYAAMELVSASMDTVESEKNEKDEKRKGDSSFMTLFGYIRGANDEGEKIAMTAPVLIAVKDPKSKTMSFVLPKEVARDGVPQPKNEGVTIESVRKGRYAALRFKGYRLREAEEKATADLRAWLKKQNFEAVGGPLYAYYNAPWTPEFMRRNEVLLRLADNSAKAMTSR
jgi:hypothetical protein